MVGISFVVAIAECQHAPPNNRKTLHTIFVLVAFHCRCSADHCLCFFDSWYKFRSQFEEDNTSHYANQAPLHSRIHAGRAEIVVSSPSFSPAPLCYFCFSQYIFRYSFGCTLDAGQHPMTIGFLGKMKSMSYGSSYAF